jgi:hypothetical protein
MNVVGDIVVNYWAVLVSGVAAMVIGFIWYMPQVLGNSWMAAIGKTKEQIEGEGNYWMFVWSYVFAIVMAFVLAHFLKIVAVETLTQALTTAFWIWLGFIATVVAMNVMYEKRCWPLFWINSLYQLLTLAVMAIILFYWQ